MTLLAGNVSADSSGNPSGTGLALALAQVRLPDLLSAFASMTPPAPVSARAIQGCVSSCNSDAKAMLPYLVANGVVSVVVPANAFGAGIPAAPVTLTGSIG